MNALVYPNIDQGIHKGKKSKIAQNEKNIENIEHLIFKKNNNNFQSMERHVS